MSKRSDIFVAIADAIDAIPEIKRVYLGVIPNWNQVTQFPSCAMVWEEEERKREGIGQCRTRVFGELSIYLYARQPVKNSYQDVISDNVELINSALQMDTTLKSLVFEVEIVKIQEDGGIIHPSALAMISVTIDYYL